MIFFHSIVFNLPKLIEREAVLGKIGSLLMTLFMAFFLLPAPSFPNFNIVFLFSWILVSPGQFGLNIEGYVEMGFLS